MLYIIKTELSKMFNNQNYVQYHNANYEYVNQQYVNQQYVNEQYQQNVNEQYQQNVNQQYVNVQYVNQQYQQNVNQQYINQQIEQYNNILEYLEYLIINYNSDVIVEKFNKKSYIQLIKNLLNNNCILKSINIIYVKYLLDVLDNKYFFIDNINFVKLVNRCKFRYSFTS